MQLEIFIIPGTDSDPPRVKVDVVVLTLSRLPFLLSVLLLTLEFLGDAESIQNEQGSV